MHLQVPELSAALGAPVPPSAVVPRPRRGHSAVPHGPENPGSYSNKSRGMRAEATVSAQPVPAREVDTPQKRARRLTWAALTKLVYEVDPPQVPLMRQHDESGCVHREFAPA
jgi:hypothetical protein